MKKFLKNKLIKIIMLFKRKKKINFYKNDTYFSKKVKNENNYIKILE